MSNIEDELDELVLSRMLEWAKDTEVSVAKIQEIRKLLKDRGYTPLSVKGARKADPKGPLTKLADIKFDGLEGIPSEYRE